MPAEILKHGAMRFQLAGRSDKGLVRDKNEDHLILSGERGLFGVCDGMGGHAAGEIASWIASEEVLSQVTNAGEDPGAVLRRGIESANGRIFREQANNTRYRGMGTTASLLWLSPTGTRQGWVAHVGDSRIYLYNAQGLRQLTADHSPVFRLFLEGVLSKDQIRQHPHKNLLERSLGVLPTVEPDVFATPLDKGDVLLICSDGLTDELTDREIGEILSEGEVDQKADRLLSQAIATGGRDNISLVVLRIVGEDQK